MVNPLPNLWRKSPLGFLSACGLLSARGLLSSAALLRGARPGRFLRGAGTRRGGSSGRRRAALASAFLGGRFVHLLSATRAARLLAAAGHLVDRGPRTAFRLVLGNAALLVAFLNVLGLAFLLV